MEVHHGGRGWVRDMKSNRGREVWKYWSLIVARVKFEPESSSSHESSSSQVKFSFFFLVVLFLIAV